MKEPHICLYRDNTEIILTLILTFIIGIVCLAVGTDFMNGFTELGTIAAVVVMGALVVYFNEKKK